MLALSAPLFAISLLAAADAPAPPAPPATPAPPTPPAVAPAPAECRVGRVWVHRSPDGTVTLSPDREFVFTPGPDESGELPRAFELVLPSGARRESPARTETLITVPKGVALQLENLMGDINVSAWDKNAVRIVAEHDRRDRLNARVVVLRRQVEVLRRQAERLRDSNDPDAARARAEVARELARQEAQADRDAQGQLNARLENRVLQIETVNRMGLPAIVDYTINVPRWMPLRLSGMETDISVDGVEAAIEAESIRGDVRVRGGRGPVQLSSVEGQVAARDCDCRLQASSINNDVELEDVSGELEVESVNGDIQIRRVKSSAVQASSVNGTVVYGGTFEPRGRYRLASHAGNLLVGVPVGAGVDVTVANWQGAFRTAFPVQVGPFRRGQKFNFVLGSGGSTLELESFQGLIELLRPEEVPAALAAPRPETAPRAPRAPARIVKVYKAPTPPAPPPAPERKEEK